MPSVLITILPGYLYCACFFTSALRSMLTSPSTVCSAFKRKNKYARTEFVVTGFAVMYVLALSFGLPIVLDLFVMNKLFALVVLAKKMRSAPYVCPLAATSIV
jgi:hypothetical protein